MEGLEKHLDQVITGAFGLIGVIQGFCLQLLSNHLSQRKRIKEEFFEIRNSIYKPQP